VSNAECKLDPAPAETTTVAYLGNKFPVVEYFANQLESCEGGNLTVNLDWLPANERDQKANLVLSSGDTSYEIIQATQRNIYEWGAKGWIMPLNDLIDKYKEQYNLADIPQPVFEAVTLDGNVYGIPFNQNGQIFFYRKDIYDKYNLKPPVTWEEAMTQFKMLAEKKDTPYVYAATYAKGSDLAGEFARTYQSAGGTWFNEDGTPAFNTPEAVASVNLIKDLLQYAPPDVLTYNNDKVMVALQQGQVAAAITYISRTARMDDPSQSTVVGKIEYAPVPAFKQGGPSGTSVGGDSYVIPAKTKVDPDMIFRIIMEATTAERQKPAANLSMMTRQSIANDAEVVKMNRYLPAVTEAIAGDSPALPPYPKVPYYSLAVGALGNVLAQAMTGDITAEAALTQATEEYEVQAVDKGFIK
jgi:ABC-type glycerol-3-phosphate transport system substrate-binding protein